MEKSFHFGRIASLQSHSFQSLKPSLKLGSSKTNEGRERREVQTVVSNPLLQGGKKKSFLCKDLDLEQNFATFLPLRNI